MEYLLYTCIYAVSTTYVLLIVVAQSYEIEADNEYVIRGNSAVMKCEVPSFVSDFVDVELWQDSLGNTYLPGADYGKSDKDFVYTLIPNFSFPRPLKSVTPCCSSL